jgi:hypothetical protein
MTSPKDTLLDAETRDRLRYEIGVLLDATDFSAEQSYHRGRLARALAYLHGFGTVAGLEVTQAPAIPLEQRELSVGAGLAVDQLGRLVEVPTDACIKLHRWYWQEGLALSDFSVFAAANYNVSPGLPGLPPSGIVADLFLRFRACEHGKTPSFAVGPFDATDAVVAARLRDGYELQLVPRTAAYPPPPVPPSPFPSPAEEADPVTRWEELRKVIFRSWRGIREHELAKLWNDTFIPAALLTDSTQSDLKMRDPAWVFLARVVIGATETLVTRGTEQRYTLTGDVTIDNGLRPFCLTTGALARWMGMF